jgi:hypothetical protein
MTPRERAEKCVNDWHGDDAERYTVIDYVEAAISAAEQEVRDANAKRIESLALLFDEPGWPKAARRYLLGAVDYIRSSSTDYVTPQPSWTAVQKRLDELKRAIASAAVAEKDAEIERLRAALQSLKQSFGLTAAEWGPKYVARIDAILRGEK